MRLNEYQIEIMRGVREILDKEPEYICLAIKIVCDANGYNSEEVGILQNAIDAGIDNCVSLGSFLTTQSATINRLSGREGVKFDRTLWMARAAWVDWIIETGEIQPEKRGALSD